MSDTLNAEAVDQAPEAQNEGADIEAKATRMGWRPKDEFKGDESKWIPADEFVKRGEELLPLLRTNNEALEKANRELEKKVRKLERVMEDFNAHHTKTEQRAYERAVRDLQARQAEAVAAGDVQEVHAITKEIAEMTSDMAPKPVQHPNGWTPDYVEAVEEWQAENTWFGEDRAMTAFAKELDSELHEKGWSYQRRFREIDKQIKAEFPHKFKNPARQAPNAVEGGAAAPRRGGKTYADLPPDAKAQCDKFVRTIPGFTREQYAKDFFGA